MPSARSICAWRPTRQSLNRVCAVHGFRENREFAAGQRKNGPIRAMISHNHLVIAISGNEVYRINETGAGTRIGTITLGGTKRVALSANRNHVIAVTGQNAYIITGSNVTAVTDT